MCKLLGCLTCLDISFWWRRRSTPSSARYAADFDHGEFPHHHHHHHHILFPSRKPNKVQCNNIYKGLANAKRPCDCRVLCLRLKSSLCSCAHSISDMTAFGCRDQGRDSVCPVLWMSTWRNQKARVNDGRNYDSLKPLTDPHHMVTK